MYIPGHLAVGWLCARASTGERTPRLWFWRVLCPSLLGALTPDLLDKSYYILRISPYGRTIGHSIALWLAVGIVLWGVGRARQGHPLQVVFRWWWVGACSHLLADACNDLVGGLSHSYYIWSGWWAWPLATPDHFEVRVWKTLFEPCRGCTSALEWAVLALALVSMSRWFLNLKRARRFAQKGS